jgi:hypothetical protein
MLGWLGVNAFFIAISLIFAGLFFVLFWLVRWMEPSFAVERWLGTLAAVLALAGTFYVGRWLHGFIDRHVVNRGYRHGTRS